MTSDVLESHVFWYDYLEPEGEADLATLSHYLMGNPDTNGWRSTYRDGGMVPVAHNGKLFPRWALLDLYKLMQMRPGIETQILHENIKLGDLPPLEVVVNTTD